MAAVIEILLAAQLSWLGGGHFENPPRASGVAGVYKTCQRPDVCKIVELRADGTFSYTPDDALVKWPPFEGRWEALSAELLVANTIEQPSPAPLVALSRPRSPKLTFCVMSDVSGVPLPDAWISFSADGIAAAVNTDDSGCIALPRYQRVSSIEVIHCRYETAAYESPDPDANVFRIRLRARRPLLTGQKWLVRGGQLYFLASDPLSLQ